MLKKLKNYVMTGLLILVPFFATAAVVWKSFCFFDDWIRYFGVNFPGAGIIVLLLLLTLTGMLARQYIGRKLYHLADWAMLKVPLVNTVYTTVREVIKTILNHEKNAFQSVVSIKFLGHNAIGFVTGDCPEPISRTLPYGSRGYKMVYVMQAFSPAAGYILMVPVEELHVVNMPVEAAIKLVLTGGMVKSEELEKASIPMPPPLKILS